MSVSKTAKRLVMSATPRYVCSWRLRPHAGRSVLLTFDDGPHPETTRSVLELLAEFDAKAIFFVVGNRIPRAPEMLAEIVRHGHLIGNHTYTHPLDRRMALMEYYRDLERCQQEIERLTQVRPVIHRPPEGQLTFASMLAPQAVGLRTLLWSQSAEDWRFSDHEAAVASAERLAEVAEPRDVLLFHDEKEFTLTALSRLLPDLKARGLSFSPNWDTVL